MSTNPAGPPILNNAMKVILKSNPLSKLLKWEKHILWPPIHNVNSIPGAGMIFTSSVSVKRMNLIRIQNINFKPNPSICLPKSILYNKLAVVQIIIF